MIPCHCDYTISHGGAYCKDNEDDNFLLWKDNREVLCYDTYYCNLFTAKLIEILSKTWMIVGYNIMYILTLTLFLCALSVVIFITEDTFNKDRMTKTPLFKTISILSQISCFIYFMQWSYEYTITKTHPTEFLVYLPVYILGITSGTSIVFACVLWLIAKFPLCFGECFIECTQPDEKCCAPLPARSSQRSEQAVNLAVPLIASEVSEVSEVSGVNTQQPPKITDTV